MNKPAITGQLFFRRAGKVAADGRQIMIAVGVIAVNDSDLEQLDEVQCTVFGDMDIQSMNLTSIFPGESFVNDKSVGGATIGDLLFKPMWRV